MKVHGWKAWTGVLVVAAILALGCLVAGCGKKDDSEDDGINATDVKPPAEEKGCIIALKPNATGAELSCDVHKGTGADHVRWQNKTTANRTLTFDDPWPFMGTNAPIVLAPNEFSAWYTVKATAANGPYIYKVAPTLTQSGPAPGEAVITVGD